MDTNGRPFGGKMKNCIISIIRQLLKLFFLFPIRENRVFFSAYSGKSFSCNPKYVSQWLCAQAGDRLELIWAFRIPKQFSELDRRIRKVKFKSLPYLYYLLTSRVVVDNVESWSILPKRKGQLVINTWHGGGAYKGVGLRRLDTDNGMDINMLQKHARVDLYLSSSKAFTKMTLRESFMYSGEVLECGMPRNDLLIRSDADIKTILKRAGISGNVKLALYAPTFRRNHSYDSELDYQRVLNALGRRFGGEWKLLYRAHYYLEKHKIMPENVLDVTDYPDMQELLSISDVLLTDYSSAIWDFSLMEKPAFLYTPDLKEYETERDFYTPIASWPYPYSCTMEELVDSILTYQKEKAVERIRSHHKELGCQESGHATEIVGKRILKECRISNVNNLYQEKYL